MKTIEFNGHSYEYSPKPCPFCARDPEVKLEGPSGWDGRCWAWIRCGCAMSLHHGVCRSTSYQSRDSWDVIKYQTAEVALADALKDLIRTWNERKEPVDMVKFTQ